jgi:aminopeptidase S
MLLVMALMLAACAAPQSQTPRPPAPSAPASSTPTSAQAADTTLPATASPAPTQTAAPAARVKFSVKRVLTDTLAIERFGIREGGSAQERDAAGYVADRLRSMGYAVTIQKFHVPSGTSRNVTARVRGETSGVLVLGGHLDTRSTTPGANDNAAGCAIVLEIARIMASEKPPVSLEFTLFGSEEYNDGVPRDHHRGSRYHVARMTKAQRKQTIGMISVDVVGYGSRLYTRTMGIGPRTMSDYLRRRAKATGVKLTYLKDPGPTGWSDHEAYEKAGIPAVWLERLQDPQYHKAGDTTAHLQSAALSEAGRLVLDAVRNMDASEVAAISKGR